MDDEPTPNWPLLEGLATGPETQIDPKMGEILQNLEGKPLEEVKSAIHKAMDYGARYAMASGFVMQVLDIEWKRLGGTLDDPTPWRQEIEEAEGL